MLGILEGPVGVEAGAEVWAECLRSWYFSGLASGSFVGVALGRGRCYP